MSCISCQYLCMIALYSLFAWKFLALVVWFKKGFFGREDRHLAQGEDEHFTSQPFREWPSAQDPSYPGAGMYPYIPYIMIHRWRMWILGPWPHMTTFGKRSAHSCCNLCFTLVHSAEWKIKASAGTGAKISLFSSWRRIGRTELAKFAPSPKIDPVDRSGTTFHRTSLAPTTGPDALYSGLLECPLTTRITKHATGLGYPMALAMDSVLGFSQSWYAMKKLSLDILLDISINHVPSASMILILVPLPTSPSIPRTLKQQFRKVSIVWTCLNYGLSMIINDYHLLYCHFASHFSSPTAVSAWGAEQCEDSHRSPMQLPGGLRCRRSNKSWKFGTAICDLCTL